MVLVNQSNLNKISELINFLEFDSLSVPNYIQNFSFNFVFNDISSLSSLSIESIQNIISSPFLHLQNENQLFLVIKDLIQEERTNLEFLKYISFGLINISPFLTLINSIQFHEINSCLFNIMKSSFSSITFFH
jgi:hypothetical protein